MERARGKVAKWTVLVAVALGALIVKGQALLALVVPATIGVLLLAALTRALRDREGDLASHARLVQWTGAAFVTHLAFGLIVTNIPTALKYLGGDANTYHVYASWLVEFGKGSLGPWGLERGKEGFYYELVGLYKIFGPHTAAGLALNATLSAALVPLMTDVTRRLFGREAARYTPPLVVLLPSIFLFTSQLLKEASILFLLAVAAAAAVRILDRVTFAVLVVLTAALSLGLTFRGPVAFVGALAFVLAIALGRRQVLTGVTTAFGTAVIVGILVLSVGVGRAGFETAINSSSLEHASRVRAGLAFESESGFGAEVDTNTPSQAISYLPIALATFSVGPFPWQIRGVRQLPGLLDVIALWCLLPSMWRGVRAGFRRVGRRMAVLVLPAVVMTLPLSLSVGNYGVLVRERMQVVLLFVPIAALGLALRADRRREVESLDAQPANLTPAPVHVGRT